jgi:hypothetical protein
MKIRKNIYLFCFSGQTGAGKTYTIIGDIAENITNVVNESKL